MLEISRSEEAARIAKQSALWESNGSPPIAANIDKFKKDLALEEIEAIEAATGEYMDLYHYSRLAAARARLDEAALQAARARSEEKRALAWAALRASRPQDYALRRRRADYIEMCRQNLLRAPF
jgi:hypothetical protein